MGLCLLTSRLDETHYLSFVKCLIRVINQLPEFTLKTWHGLVDYVTVYAEDDIRFTFKNGQEVKA